MIFFGGGEATDILRHTLSKCTHFQSRLKISGQSADVARGYGAAVSE